MNVVMCLIIISRYLGRWTLIDSIWWCLMTLTTVGDKRTGPTTMMGQILAGLCAVVGVFILALPVPIVVNSFANCYKNQMWRNEVAQQRQEKLSRIKKSKEKGVMKGILGMKGVMKMSMKGRTDSTML